MLLGDQGEVSQKMRRNLARTGTSHLLEPWRSGPSPPATLGSVALEYLKPGPDQAFALAIACQGRRALILPPGRKALIPAEFTAENGLDLLVLPAALAESPGDLSPVLTRLQPLRLVVYGEMQKMRPGKT